MAIRDIKETGKQPTAIEHSRRDHFSDTRLHSHYIGMSELR